MLRLCYRNILPSQNVFSLSSFEKYIPSIKCTASVQKIIKRHYMNKEDSDIELHRIYYGPLTPQIRAVKMFSLGSSIAGLSAQPIILREASNIGSTSLLIVICSIVGFFTFITPLLLHVITKKYVTEVHFNPNTSTYKATTLNFFLVQKQLEFKTEDVVVPDIPGIFTTVRIKGTPLFIEARHFNDPLHYAKIMGYDKPLDFKLGNIEESESSTK